MFFYDPVVLGEGGRIILPEAKGKLRAETRLRLILTFYRKRSILT
jgi:hypothetical protein